MSNQYFVVTLFSLCVFVIGLIGETGASTGNWTAARVIWGQNTSTVGANAYLKLYNTLDEALESGQWQCAFMENDLNATFVALDEDYTYMPIYDSYGWLSGAQVCVSVEAILRTGPPTYEPWNTGAMEIKTTPDGILNFCSKWLWVDPTTLRAGGRETIKASLGEGLWVLDPKDQDTGYKRIPDDVETLLEETAYTWLTCVPNMGTHFFYNITLELDCHNIYNWFLTSRNGSISGIGFHMLGQPITKTVPWFDNVTEAQVYYVTPTSITNQCLFDWAFTYGLISLHTYFQDDPWTITCDADDSPW